MESNSEGSLKKKMDANKNDATASFPNAEKKSAAEINNGGDKKAKNYMRGEDDVNGPDMDEDSKEADGDTTVNAGVHR